jgi:predicted dinucleotide-binding enzyme
MMNIGVIGSGNIGGTLGKLWAKAGHNITFGTRDPNSNKIKMLLNEAGESASAATIAEAIAANEVILIATPWSAVSETVSQGSDWSGKVIMDATNRFGSDSPNSGAEDLAAMIPDAKVIKAFNAIGFNRLEKPEIDGQVSDIFICGDDANAKEAVSTLITDIGFGVVDCGGLSNAGLVESLARLWISLSRSVGREIAFKLLRA